MMTVEEALRNMLKEISLIRDIETVSLMGAMGRIAAEDCVVRSPVPAFPVRPWTAMLSDPLTRPERLLMFRRGSK